MKIVSLLASATESLCALGLRQQLVGISHECDYPPDVEGLPVVSEPKIDVHRSSREVDRAVRELAKDGLSVYRVKTDLLQALRPDLIVTQDQCEVCAVSLKDVEEAVSGITLTETRICSLRPETLQGILDSILHLARMAGVEERGQQLVQTMRSRLGRIAQRVKRVRVRPRVACVEWLDPLIMAGGWMPEIVRIAGGSPALVRKKNAATKPTWERVEAEDPDIVVIMPCGYALDQTRKELGDGANYSTLAHLRATKKGRCFIVDGNAYFNRPGPRIVESAEILAGLFYPDICGDFLATHSTSLEAWPVL